MIPVDRMVELSNLNELRIARAQRRRYMLRAVTASLCWGWRDQHLVRGWQLPHRVYVLHLLDECQFNVGLTRADSNRRIRNLGCGRTASLVEDIETSNRLIAELVEVDVLKLVEPWHQLGDHSRTGRGYTERWRDGGPSIDLAEVLAGVRRDVAEALESRD